MLAPRPEHITRGLAVRSTRRRIPISCFLRSRTQAAFQSGDKGRAHDLSEEAAKERALMKEAHAKAAEARRHSPERIINHAAPAGAHVPIATWQSGEVPRHRP